jgi:hypothetical protein
VGKLQLEKKIPPNVNTRKNKFPHLLLCVIFHISRQNGIKGVGKHILGFSRYASNQNCQAVSAGNWVGLSDHLSQITNLGVKELNMLPSCIKIEFDTPKKFKLVLQKFLYENSFHSLVEYFELQKS